MIQFSKYLAIVLVLTGMATAACKPKTGTANGAKFSAPERQGTAGDASASLKVGVLGQGGGKGLTMDLQKTPDPKEAAALWACWSLPADDFALGRAVCKSDAQKSVEITGANVSFTCGSNPEFGIVKAKRPLSTDFCASYDVFAYQFKPAFNVKVAD